jgi:hypothetical protein
MLSTAPASNSIAMCTPTLCSAMPRPPVQELKEAAATRKPRKRRLPKGTSDYQAAWILDDRCAYRHTHECIPHEATHCRLCLHVFGQA